MPEHYNTAFGQIVDWMDQQRKQTRDTEDAEIDKRIALIHDLINGPGANPARTAEGLSNMMELMGAKGGRGKRAKGMEGFMGKGVIPDSSLLSGLIHGSIPMQGNTTEPVPQPQSAFERGAMPEASAILPGLSTSLHPQSYNGGISNGNIDLAAQPSVPNPDGSRSTVDSSSYGFDGKEVLLPSVTPDGRHLQGDAAITGEYQRTGRNLGTFANPDAANAYAGDLHNDYAAGKFDGKSILNTPIMIPPEPIKAAPTADGMLSAARDMQKYQEGPKTRPVANQPMFRSPEEMAQLKGNAEGIETGAKRDAEYASDVKYWKSIGMSDAEIKEMVKRKAMGNTGQMQDAEGGFWTVGDKVVHAIRVFDPRTGVTQTIDSLTRLPLPPNATPAAAPAQSKSETDPTSLKEYNAYVEDETARGNTKILSYDNWLTLDANRKKSTTNINVAGTSMTNQDRTAFNQIVNRFQTSPLMKAKDRTVTLMANIGAVEKNPSNAAAQLALGYSFVQALDTYQSAVREGELKNLTLIDSRLGNLQLWAQQMVNGQIQRPEVAKQIAQSAKLLALAISDGATAKQQQFKSQAQVNGLRQQWDEYVAGFAGGAEPQNTGGAKAGDKKVAPNGRVLYFDGTGWGTEPVMPPPPGR